MPSKRLSAHHHTSQQQQQQRPQQHHQARPSAKSTSTFRAINHNLSTERAAHALVASSDRTTPDRRKRTGRACVRCQGRKIKCDTDANGCRNCRDAGERCETKDPLSNNTQERGHTEQLQHKLNRSELYVQKLIDLCQEHNLELPQSGLDDNDPFSSPIPYPNLDNGSKKPLPGFDCKRIGENYLGASTTQSLTVPQGSRITLFDNKIDYNDFVSSDDHTAFTITDEQYNAYSTGRISVKVPPFPLEEDARTAANLFFIIVGPFTPVVHRPHLNKLLDRIYRDGHTLSDGERVLVNMVLSVTGFQCAVRQNDKTIRDDAKTRFLYSLTFVQDFCESYTLENMQALVLMCITMRNFPRPGPAWRLCSRVMAFAIELGMHRSVHAWETPPRQMTDHEIHMHKRLFWSLMVVVVNINAKFGKPMPLLDQYIDVEIPLPENDSFVDNTPSCSWHAAPWGFKLTRIILQAQTHLNTLRRTSSERDGVIKELLDSLDSLEQSLPSDMIPEDACNQPDRIAALYMQLGMESTRLLIRHPAHLNAPHGWEVSDDNLGQCLKLASNIREVALKLQTDSALDTTLYYSMDLLCAIFVMLFIYSRRHDNALRSNASTKQIYNEADREINKWYPVLKAVDSNLGSGGRFINAVHKICQSCLVSFESSANEAEVAASTASINIKPDAVSRMDDVSLQRDVSAGPLTGSTQASVYENGLQYAQDLHYGSTTRSSPSIMTPHDYQQQQQQQLQQHHQLQQQLQQQQQRPTFTADVAMSNSSGETSTTDARTLFAHQQMKQTPYPATLYDEHGQPVIPLPQQQIHGFPADAQWNPAVLPLHAQGAIDFASFGDVVDTALHSDSDHYIPDFYASYDTFGLDHLGQSYSQQFGQQ